MGRGMKRAVVLVSGGLDSATCLWWALREGYEPVALSFDYGQRHAVELQAAARLAQQAQVHHEVLRVPLDQIGGSALTDTGIEVPKNRAIDKTIPVTYVPGRNTVFLALALSTAEAIGAEAIVIGANALDYSGYPDCRPEYVEAWNRLIASLGLAIRVEAPLIDLSKQQIGEFAKELGVPVDETHSCYDPDAEGGACGACDSCQLRALILL